MSQTIVIRIPDPLFRRVRQSAKARKTSRSALIREALEDYFERTGLAAERDPYSLLLSLMPFEGSGRTDLGSRSEEYLKERFRARSHSR
jgi:hypothetical protein